MRALILGCFVVGGCATTTGALQERAAADYKCNAGDVHVKELGKRVYRVEGCGHVDTWVCDGNDDCNREVRPDELAPAKAD